MPKKFNKANKKATKGKNVMWKKGYSCTYNPAFNKHRLEAKQRSGFNNKGKGNLTESLLAQHNNITLDNQNDADDTMSVGADSALTSFTNCSLPSFNRLLKSWNSNSFLQKEMVAVLAAVTDVLKSRGGKETETEYFAALMSTLDVVDTDEGVIAVINLLHMIVKKLDESVLKLNFKSSCETYSKLLIKFMNSDHCSLLRNLLNVVFTFLKVKAHWSDSTQELKIILEFTTHHKPKVRRVAQNIISTILRDHIPEKLNVHPSASTVANFCIESIEKHSGKSAESRNVFYVLALLKDIIAVLPKILIKKACETIFRVMTLSSSIMTQHCLQTLQGLFVSNPSSENLPVDLNARIITALYDFQPNVKDSQSLIDWLHLMESAIINLVSSDEKLCISHLPKFYSVSVKCWLNESDNVMALVALILTNILEKCINPSGEVFQQLLFEDPVNNTVHKMFHCVEGALSYQYHTAWKFVLVVLAKFFEVIGKYSYTVMTKCLQSLGDLRDSYKFPCISELEKAIGCAISHMGPEIVLQSISLQLDANSEKSDFPRSWMLPLLRDNIRNTQLEFFSRYFLNLADKIKNKSYILQQEGKIVESKLCNVVCSQIWSLLPGFCTEPTDLKKCFKEVAKTLGMVLKNDPSLRMTILGSLRLLISKNINNDENREEIASFAKNYLPILFNLYTTESKNKEEERVRLAVYETCKAYLQISDKELCEYFFDKAVEKMSSSTETFMQHALFDLCKAIFPLCSIDKVKALYEYSKPLLKDSNHTTQKKAYSVIKEICSSESESCKLFVNGNLEGLWKLFGTNVTGLTPSARAFRLNCLQHIVSQISPEQKDFIFKITPEAILCTKENSAKARSTAFNLLCDIGVAFKRFHPNNSKGALEEYMSLLVAGLAGSPHMMSATILAIGRVVFEFKEDLDSKMIHMLVENMCLLLTSPSREVTASAISFVKILFKTVDVMMLVQHVEPMIKNITSISEEHQRKFRFQAKELFTRLIKKFGYEMIYKMVPESYQKLVNNIRKSEANKKNKKSVVEDRSYSEHQGRSKSDNFEDILADSDEERLDDEIMYNTNKKPRKKTFVTCIEENDDDIVDFLDPAVNKKLLTVRHAKEERKIPKFGGTNSFPMAEDGRLIIEDNEDTKSTSKSKEIDLKTEVLMELGATTKKNKRKLEDSDDEDISLQNKKGIHRNLPPKKRGPGEEYKSKKSGGDVKKGKYEPYAFIPLNRQALNKRKQVKLKGQYKNIVKGAKKGAMTGLKRKARQAKRKHLNA